MLKRQKRSKRASIGKIAKTYNEIAKNVKFGKNCVLRNFIFIGEGVVLGDNVKVANFCNIDRYCRIGNNCNLQVYVVLSQGTIVGDNCFFAGHVSVADEKFPAAGKQIRKPTVFGNNVVVGMGALIIGGITIGDNAVIGMGSVVTKDVPANEVWVGNPAKPIISRATGKVMTREEYNSKKTQWEGQIEQA